MITDMHKLVAALSLKVDELESRQSKHTGDIASLWKRSSEADKRLSAFKPTDVEKAMKKLDEKVKQAVSCIAIRTQQQMVLTEIVTSMRRQRSSPEEICHAMRCICNAIDEKNEKWWENTIRNEWTISQWMIWILKQPKPLIESNGESMIAKLQ